MTAPLSPELEAKAQELATRIRTRSADAILGMARRLVATTDDTLFGVVALPSGCVIQPDEVPEGSDVVEWALGE
jgi:hypothetical protein